MPALALAVILAAGGATVAGEIEAQDSRWDGGVIVTRSTLRVDAVLAGAAPARIELVHVGGARDGYGQRLSTEVELALGERVMLDVEPRVDGWRVTGGAHGKHAPWQPWLYVRTTTAVSSTCQGYQAKPLYWRALDVPLTMDAALTADVPAAAAQAALDASIATWNAVDCAYLKLIDAGTTTAPVVGYQRSGPNTNLVTWLESGWSQSALAIAATLTTFECASGKLVDADVLFNGQNFTFSAAAGGAPATADIENTFTHELGHLVGFDHNPDPASTMFAEAGAGEIVKRDLTADDAAGMCAVYPVGQEPDLDEGGRVFFTMKRVRGHTLERVLEREHALRVALQVGKLERFERHARDAAAALLRVARSRVVDEHLPHRARGGSAADRAPAHARGAAANEARPYQARRRGGEGRRVAHPGALPARRQAARQGLPGPESAPRGSSPRQPADKHRHWDRRRLRRAWLARIQGFRRRGCLRPPLQTRRGSRGAGAFPWHRDRSRCRTASAGCR